MLKVFSTFISIGSIISVAAQSSCIVHVNSSADTICQGGNVTFHTNSVNSPSTLLFDFNIDTIPPGWSLEGYATFTAPCFPSMDTTAYYWSGTANTTPSIETTDFQMGNGSMISFEFIYCIQGNPFPCEGPDETDEGVSVQYSTDGGLSWFDLIYYSPGGIPLPGNPGGNNIATTGPTAYTVWNTDTLLLPAGAWGNHTRFRWIQLFSSGGCCDNWGLDNIRIHRNPTMFYDWTPGGQGFGMTTNTLNNIQNSTWVTVTATDTLSGISCTDSTFLLVYPPPVVSTFYTNPLCEEDTLFIDMSNSISAGGISSYRYDMDNNGIYEFNSGTNPIFPIQYFFDPGIFSFGTQVVSPWGCSSQQSYQLSVYAKPTVILNATPTLICTGDSVHFTCTSFLNNPPSLPSSVQLYSWDFDGDGTVDVSGPTLTNTYYTYSSPGSFNAELYVETSAGCIRNVSVPIEVCNIAGFTESENDDINLYPNPATDMVWLSGLPHQAEVQITDQLGRQIMRLMLQGATASPIFVNGLSPGLYYIHIGSYVGKLIKQ